MVTLEQLSKLKSDLQRSEGDILELSNVKRDVMSKLCRANNSQ